MSRDTSSPIASPHSAGSVPPCPVALILRLISAVSLEKSDGRLPPRPGLLAKLRWESEVRLDHSDGRPVPPLSAASETSRRVSIVSEAPHDGGSVPVTPEPPPLMSCGTRRSWEGSRKWGREVGEVKGLGMVWNLQE
eukprot:360315-Chlamydomonas_euryale.AAC.4